MEGSLNSVQLLNDLILSDLDHQDEAHLTQAMVRSPATLVFIAYCYSHHE